MNAPVVVIGIGNSWRGDDGVGWAVIDELEAHASHHPRSTIDLVRTDGEAARLIECWDGRALAVVVDAVVTGATPGTIIHLDPAAVPAGGAPIGSHSLGLDHAMALGRALGRLPRRLLVVGVEGTAFADGSPLSPPVGAALPDAVAAVEALISEVSSCA